MALFPSGRTLDRRRLADTSLPVSVEFIGRSAAGKTAILTGISQSVISFPFPSGLCVGQEDPTRVAVIQSQVQLRTKRGLTSTIEETSVTACLFDSDNLVGRFCSTDCVGQFLTYGPDAPLDHRRRRDVYLDRLSRADVVWVVVPAPPAGKSSLDQRRYENDLQMTASYLGAALRCVPQDGRSVVIIVSKLDSLFQDSRIARKCLTDERLRTALSPVVRVAEQSQRVANAVIAPVTAFGWGRAQRTNKHDHNGDGEPHYQVRPGWAMRPCNLAGLMAWTFLAGLTGKELECDSPQEQTFKRVAEKLARDVYALDAWLVNVKGNLVE